MFQLLVKVSVISERLSLVICLFIKVSVIVAIGS